jgi:hypothetical protein
MKVERRATGPVADIPLASSESDPHSRNSLEPHHGLESTHLQNAEALFGGPQGLLRSAAAAVADAGTGDAGGDPADPAEPEIRALARFGHEAGLIWKQRL